jgi:hypothetical protein
MYTLEFLPATGPAAPPAASMREAEAALLRKRGELQGFEAEFRQVRARAPAGPPRRGRRAAGRRQGVFAALVGACRPVSTLAALQVYVGVAGAGCEERRCVCGDGMRGGPQRHLHAERLPP